MPQSWLNGVGRRSVETDYQFYDPPEVIWEKINNRQWPYKGPSEFRPYDDPELYVCRDLAYMSLLWAATARASELCRADLYRVYYRCPRCGYSMMKWLNQETLQCQQCGDSFKKDSLPEPELRYWNSKPSITKKSFRVYGDWLHIRDLPILKIKYIKKGDKWQMLNIVDDYPVRREIELPLIGGFISNFTKAIVSYVRQLKDEEELFKFKYRRGWQIVTHCTTPLDEKGNPVLDDDGKPLPGEMQHYLRDMGLKFRSRIYDRNIKDLQKFSGHRRIENLAKYLGEGKARDKLQKYGEVDERNGLA